MTIDNLPTYRESLSDRLEYSKALAISNLLPPQYRGKPENVLYAIEFGRSLGIEPIVAITGVHIIEGKPTASAGLISALVRRAGHRLRVWVERDDQGRLVKAVATIHRSDDPDFEFRSEWTMARAQAAGLTGKQVWRTYPEAMLKARAITEVAREACEEALSGVSYTPEELGAEVNPDGSVVVTTAPARMAQPGQTIRDAVTQATPAPATASDTTSPEPAPAGHGTAEPMITDTQRRKLGSLMRKAGITDRAAALEFVADVIGRQVSSRNELTLTEADQVIDRLENPPAAEDEQPVDTEIDDADAEAYEQAVDEEGSGI